MGFILQGFWRTWNAWAKRRNGRILLLTSLFFSPFQPWPEEALERVAESFLKTLELSKNERREVIPICQTFHTSAKTLSERFDVFANILKGKFPIFNFTFTTPVHYFSKCRFLSELGRHNYVTPTSYLELIAAFRLLLTQKRDTVMNAKQRYISGLEKLAFAESQVCVTSNYILDTHFVTVEIG